MAGRLVPDPDCSADPAAFDTDGEITAEEIARTWELDANLVVLSACESRWASRPAKASSGSRSRSWPRGHAAWC